MKYLWSRWPQVEQRICGSRHLLLLLDYDGTLTPIAPSPKQATLPRATKSILRKLSRNPRLSVALISGRALAELRQLVGLRGLTYIGNHGLEFWREGERTVLDIPQSSREALDQILPRLAELVSDIPGTQLENKGLAVGLHYRQVPRDESRRLKAAVRQAALPFVRSGALTLLNGKRVIEVRPSVHWTKGHAALWLIRQVRRRSVLPIYVGDDQTDEEAFRMLKDGITIHVGAGRRSTAQYYVKSVKDVFAFLEWMAARCA